MHAPRSQMSGLDFHTEPLIDCSDDDSGDIAFIQATKFVGGRDTMEEFLACGVYSLAANVGFDRVAVGVTPILKLKMPLPKFVASHDRLIRLTTPAMSYCWGCRLKATEIPGLGHHPLRLT
jgi:hypothetical protein